MEIVLNPRFRKNYRAKITPNRKLMKRVEDRIDLFRSDRQHPSIKDHQLTGLKREFRAFSITGDIRIIYRPISADKVVFIDIGSHNQVY